MNTTAARSDTAQGVLAILIWSTTVAVSRSLTEQLGPLTAVASVFLLGGGVGLALHVLIRSRHAPRSAQQAPANLRYLLGGGALFVAYQACLYLALGLAEGRSQALEVALTNYLWPMLTLLFSVALLRLPARPWLIAGAMLAMGGVLLATTQHQPLTWSSFRANLATNGLPYLLGSSAGALWALYSVLSRAWQGDDGAVPGFMVATGIVLGAVRLMMGEDTRWTPRALGELLFLASASNLAYVFWDRGVRRGDIVLLAAVSYLIPLLSTLVSTLYLGVAPGPRLWVGGILVVAGAALCRISVRYPDAANIESKLN
jgi:drug/metabolite transporter (DMT)-like permease